ncbi:MAG: epoxyqueuosine reductase [Anaerolineae bacterium]|nr:epoxyqueuosine reductase [Anaerolineae bacterium]
MAQAIIVAIQDQVAQAGTVTGYREPLVGFAAADDPHFLDLRRIVEPSHMLPQDLLPGARSVVAFFLPFAQWVVEANAQHREQVAPEWVTAYVETNALIGRINTRLIELLAGQGVGAAAQPATHNFDPVSLVCRWAHKSVAVIAGLGSFGLHQMVITDAGCAGRFGSLVLDADLPIPTVEPKQRCLYFRDGSCVECVQHCPAGALAPDRPLDKQLCRHHQKTVAQKYGMVSPADVCGKCAIGPCSFESAVT